MTQRIVIPVENNLGINAQVAQHFGQAPYFVLVELDANKIVKVEIEKNTSTHMGGTGDPHGGILSLATLNHSSMRNGSRRQKLLPRRRRTSTAGNRPHSQRNNRELQKRQSSAVNSGLPTPPSPRTLTPLFWAEWFLASIML